MLTCAATIALLCASPAYAEVDASAKSIDRQKLLGLAKSFVNNVGTKLEKVERQQERSSIERQPSIDESADTKRTSSLSIIPDGTELLFQLKSGQLIFNVDIYGLKEAGGMYLSLNDVIDYFELSIDYNEETNIASGWFLREDWEIEIDLNEGAVTSRGEKYQITDGDIINRDGDVFIKAEAIGAWMDMDFEFDTAQQYVDVVSAWPLPAVVRENRKNRRTGITRRKNEAVLPRLETKRSLLDINTANANLLTRFNRNGTTHKTTRSLSSSAAVEGQLLYQDAYALANIEQYEGVKSVTGRLSRQSEEQDLLGPLGATSYAIGDIEPLRLPLLGRVSRELGFTVTNSPVTVDNFETTEIVGDAIPGWDIELYRNGILIGSQEIDERAQYKFEDVPLFIGDNIFEVFFYGPMGEIRSDTVSVPVNRDVLSGQDGTYEVSATLTDRELYQANPSQDEDRNTPHLAAKYNKFIGETLIYGAFRSRDIEGDTSLVAGTGATHNWGGALFNVDLGLDQDFNAAISASARKKVDGWNFILSSHANSEEYQVDDSLLSDVWGVSSNVQKTFRPFWASNANLNASAEFNEDADGNSVMNSRLGLNAQFKRLNLSNTLYYADRSATGEELDTIFTARYRGNKYFLRGSATYEIKPHAEITDFTAQVQYDYNQSLSTDFQLSHNPVSDYSQGRWNLNYRGDYFTTSPFVQFDSEEQVYAGVNLNFTAVDTPYKKLPELTSKRLIGQGYVSSFVYHDKNGNMCYDADDEALPEVIVRSVNVKKTGETDKHGLSMIKGLPVVRATDIVLDESTLPDPFMISSYKGVSIFPKAGEIVELEFPVHLSAEIDGTIYKVTKGGQRKALKSGAVTLLSLDSPEREPITAGAAFDGFYVASRVPPGKYLMFVSTSTAQRNKSKNVAPIIVDLNYDGETIYGQDFEVIEGGEPAPISTRFITDGVTNVKEDIIYSLKVEKKVEKSKLFSLLDRLTKKRASRDLYAGLSSLYVHDDFSDDNARFTVPNNDVAMAYDRCQEFVQAGVSCELEVLIYNANGIKSYETASK